MHLGHAWTSLLADVLNRYQKQKGVRTLFITGIDEHGGKIAQVAQRHGLSPNRYVDKMHRHYQTFWRKLQIEYDCLVRTTAAQHVRVVQTVFDQLKRQGQVYAGHYQGFYCLQCEEFLTSLQLQAQVCRICQRPPQLVTQPTYFLKIAHHRRWLLSILQPPAKLVQPDYISCEVIKNFLTSSPIHDLSITRADVKWGCPVPGTQQSIYVWFDALLGYLSGTGFLDPTAQFKTWWSADTTILQLVGKEIARFHSIYWPILLKQLNLRLPNQILTHSWITVRNQKMSKSLGNSVDPTPLIDRYSVAAVRCFLFCNMKIRTDNSYHHRLFLEFYNSFLVNNLGNLHSRLTTMVRKYFAGRLPVTNPQQWGELRVITQHTIVTFTQHMDRYQVFAAAQTVMQLADACNKTIDTQQPWVLYQRDRLILGVVLGSLVYGLLVIAVLLRPVLLDKSVQILRELGFNDHLTCEQIRHPDIIFQTTGVKTTTHLFNRINVDHELTVLGA